MYRQRCKVHYSIYYYMLYDESIMSKGFYNVTILSCRTIVAEDCRLSFKETAEC